MSLPTLYQGEERHIRLNVTYSSDSSDVDFTIFDSVYVFAIINGKVIDKFRTPTAAGYEELTIDNSTNGRLTFTIPKESTVNMPSGKMQFEIKAITADVETLVTRMDAFCTETAISKTITS